MTVQAPQMTSYEKWQDGINKAVGDTRWNDWDCEIQMGVNEYNRHLAHTANYMPLDWLLIKAMLWVETGANSRDWKSKPMQIGNPHDPGLTSFLNGREGGNVILPPAWKGRLTASSARTVPTHNIRAGIGYLLMKMANYEYRDVPAADSSIDEVTVKTGDNLDKIAAAHNSTVGMLKKLNPTVNILRAGQILKCQKASLQMTVSSWRHISTNLIAQRYNGGGDSLYAKKLDYALSLIRKGRASICATS